MTEVCDSCGTCEGCGKNGAVTKSDQHPEKNLEHGFKKFWRPIAAYVYLLICVFDFMGMPMYIAYQNEQVNTEAFAEIRQLQDKDVKLKALEQLDLGSKSWTPLTLSGGGLFHLSFGAILGISAFTRGQEKKAAIEKR
jgi:hypothetical protein